MMVAFYRRNKSCAHLCPVCYRCAWEVPARTLRWAGTHRALCCGARWRLSAPPSLYTHSGCFSWNPAPPGPSPGQTRTRACQWRSLGGRIKQRSCFCFSVEPMQQRVWKLIKNNQFRGERPTNLSVEDFFLSVANRFDDLQKGLEESEVTQSAGLVVELFPLCFLQGAQAVCSNSMFFSPPQ